MSPRFVAYLVLLFVPAAVQAADLDEVLASMDEASASFQGLEAKVEWVKYTALVDDKNTESGVVAVRRSADKKVDLKIEFQEPYPYFLLVRGTKVEIYRPKIATVEEYDLSKSRDKLEQALLLGFGASGKFLRERYDIKVLGEESAAGVETVKLELIPKDESQRKDIPRIDMWVSKANWNPVQQKLHQASGDDYRLYSYSEIALNPKLSNAAFKLKIPGKTKRVFPQR